MQVLLSIGEKKRKKEREKKNRFVACILAVGNHVAAQRPRKKTWLKSPAPITQGLNTTSPVVY